MTYAGGTLGHGDSGGPLIAPGADGDRVIAGVNSVATRSESDIWFYTNWILQTMDV